MGTLLARGNRRAYGSAGADTVVERVANCTPRVEIYEQVRDQHEQHQ
jgi:hypothetical protein